MYKSWGVGREVPAKYTSQVIVELTFEHGDADGTTYEELPVSHDDVIECANFLDLCDNTTPESEGGPGYTGLPGYAKFGNLFPTDLHYSCMASLEKYQFYYYNGHGMKSLVYLES